MSDPSEPARQLGKQAVQMKRSAKSVERSASELSSAPPSPDIRPVPHALLVPINGVLLLVAVAALVGIWAA